MGLRGGGLLLRRTHNDVLCGLTLVALKLEPTPSIIAYMQMRAHDTCLEREHDYEQRVDAQTVDSSAPPRSSQKRRQRYRPRPSPPRPPAAKQEAGGEPPARPDHGGAHRRKEESERKRAPASLMCTPTDCLQQMISSFVPGYRYVLHRLRWRRRGSAGVCRCPPAAAQIGASPSPKCQEGHLPADAPSRAPSSQKEPVPCNDHAPLT